MRPIHLIFTAFVFIAATAVPVGIVRAAVVPDNPTAVPPQAAMPSATTSRFAWPRVATPSGSTVLYSQVRTEETYWVAPSQWMPPGWLIFSAKGADDFVVSSQTGWTISGVNARYWFMYQSMIWPAPESTRFTVEFFADDGGGPGVVPVCSRPGLIGTMVDDVLNGSYSIALPSPCFLPQGTYWASIYPVSVDYPPQAFWVTSSATDLGNNAVWQNHFEGFEFGCSGWSDITTCTGYVDGYEDPQHLAGGNSAFQFELIGSLGGDSCSGQEAGAGICLDVTVGTDTTEGACGTDQDLVVTTGDQVNYCYRVTNHSGMTLDYHTLSDNIRGVVFSLLPEPLEDGASYQVNRVATMGSTQTDTAAWQAQDLPPGFEAEFTVDPPAISDRLLCDGFDGASCASSQNSFIDISGFGTPADLREDESIAVQMPFSIEFFGTGSNQLCINQNGLVLFNSTTCPGGFWNNDLSNGLPTDLLPGAAIAPLWDDFADTSGEIYHATLGAAPNRQFVVAWHDVVAYDGTLNSDGATFEIVFDEAEHTITFAYADVQYTGHGSYSGDDDCSGGACATIGLQGSPELANQYSHRIVSVADDSHVDWTPRDLHVFASSDTVSVDVGESDIDIQPTSISGWVPAGGTSSFSFDIDNVGTRDLDWTTQEGPPANMHFPPAGSRFALPLGDPALASGAPVPRHGNPLSKHPRVESGPALAPLGAALVPAFADDVIYDEFVRFDANNAGVMTVVNPVVGGYKLTGGTFIDGDFSTLYAIDGFGVSTRGKLVRVDTATGAITEIGQATDPFGQQYASLKYDPVTGNLYAVSISSECSTAPSRLWTIDPVTAEATLVGSTIGANCLVSLAIDRSGLMYGIDILNDALYAIDKTNADAALIGSLGFNANFAQEADFDQSTGILYYAGFDGNAETGNMYTVDLATGAATVISPLGSFVRELDAFAIQTVYGPCSDAQDIAWLTVAPASGTTAPGGSSAVNLTVDGAGQVNGTVLAATVCVTSNDRDERIVAVPVEVTVPDAIGISKAFSPSSIETNAETTLTITLTNANPVPAVLTAELWDHFPEGLIGSPVATNPVTTCPNGNPGAPLGGDYVSMSTGEVPAMGWCTISVTVKPVVEGTLVNTIPAGALQTSLGNNPVDATASLEAIGENPIHDSGFLFLEVPADDVGIYINWMTGATCTSANGGCNPQDFNLHAFATAGQLTFDWPHATDQCVLQAGTDDCARLPYGAVIGPASPMGQGTADLWIAQDVLGFSFLNEGTGQVNYGFINFIADVNGGYPAYIVQYWFDRTGAAITAQW